MRPVVVSMSLAAVLAFVLSSGKVSLADAPAAPNAFDKAANAMNPMNWSMPKWKMPEIPMPGKKSPPVIKKKDNVFTTMSKKTAAGWNKTKQTLSPSNMFASKDKPAKPKSSEPSFFGKMFAPEEEPKRIATVNEFLAQPQPGAGGTMR